jgi:chemosensory pili system protein ChpA (sensor histidine kinase/response regulator)
MDVVRNEIATLGGRVEATSEAGKGTTFSIYLPLTLAVTQAVLVRSGNTVYALPSTMVDQVQELKADALAGVYQKQEVLWQGNHYPLYYFPRLLDDLESVPAIQRYTLIMLLHSGVQRVAVHVDELIGNREIVVKNIGPQLARIPGIAGATVLGNGKVVLILNPVQLAQRHDIPALVAEQSVAPITEQLAAAAPVVMIVDDSLTVRKITSKLLTREGYQDVTANDGVDALQALEDVTPQVMLVDIEMPRMDGFELTKNIRGNAKTAHIPIIMITSRTAEKHRNYAQELGVNVYLGKPYQEEELLGYISGFVKGSLH